MPFESKAQQRFMFSQKPEMAKRWAKETPNFKNLPEHVAKKKAIMKKQMGVGGPLLGKFGNGVLDTVTGAPMRKIPGTSMNLTNPKTPLNKNDFKNSNSAGSIHNSSLGNMIKSITNRQKN